MEGERRARRRPATHGTLDRQVARIRCGDHVCLLHRERATVLRVVVAYIRQGLERGERCVYVSGDDATDAVEGALVDAGVDADEARSRGALLLLAPDEYRPAGPWDADRMAERFRVLCADAAGGGFSGVRLAVESAWARDPEVPCAALAAWEARLNPLVAEAGRVAVLCLYDERSFPHGVGLSLLEAHPEVLLGGKLCHNPFYEPESLSLAADPDAARLEWRLEQIRRLRDEEEVRQTAEELQALVLASPLAINVIDREGKLTLWSPAAERIFGWTTEEVLGRSPPHVPEEGMEELRQLGRQVLEGKAFTGVETVRRTKDGAEVDVSISAAPLRDSEGRIWGALAVLEDITAWKELERERERLLEAERAAKTEAEERERAERALRVAAEEIAGMFTIEEVVRAVTEHARSATGADGAFVVRLQAEGAELEVVAAAGEPTPPLGSRVPYPGSLTERVLERAETLVIPALTTAGHPLPGELARSCGGCSGLAVHLVDAGGAIGTLFLIRAPGRESFRPDEITRAKTFGSLAALGFRKIHLLEDAERRREELHRVMASRTRLMHGFSHDVKNPLGAALGYLDLVEMETPEGLTETQHARVTRVRRAIRGALDLIGDLLELARAEAGEVEIERGPVDLRLVAREAADEYRAQAGRAGLRMSVEVPEEFPVIETDRSRVHQILGNLVSNAVKYTKEGGITVRVEARGAERAPRPGRWACVEVSDTGPGIPPEKRSLLFEEFSRLEPGTTTGVGLGLAISRRVARALEGEISVESDVGKGSTFTLWLPLAPEGAGSPDLPGAGPGPGA